MTSIIKVNEIQDAGGNTILSSNGTGTFTSNLPSGANTPAFYVTPSSNQTCTNTAFTQLTFDTKVLDTDNAFNTGTSLFTVPSGKGGLYAFHGCARLPLSDGNEYTFTLFINGSNYERATSQIMLGNNGSYYNQYTSAVNLSSGDTVSLYLYITSSGNKSTIASYTYFSGYKIIT